MNTPPCGTESPPTETSALARRADPGLLRLAVERVRAELLLHAVLEAVPGIAMVLNEQRQIVAANQRMLEAAEARSLEGVLGKRPGEALRCRNALASPDGCGTSHACKFCGAFAAITESHRTRSIVTRECRVPMPPLEGSALESEVVSSPISIDGVWYTVLAMRDISAEKRKRVLERLFFHDILNTAGGIRGIVSVLNEGEASTSDVEYRTMLEELAERLIEVIHQHRELLAAESGELQTHPVFVSVPDLVAALGGAWAQHESARDRHLIVGAAPDLDVVTDHGLARRVVENMIKNALEATAPGGSVTIAAEDLGDAVAIRVHNEGVVSDKVRHQIFQRSFSTKGSGRGIGTYSMRLLAERYLGAEVSFESSDERGTIFTLRVPKTWRGFHAEDGGW